jgi:hypothetical protein
MANKRERWHGGEEPLFGWFSRFLGRSIFLPILIVIVILGVVWPVFLEPYITSWGSLALIVAWVGGLIYGGRRFFRSRFYKSRW